MSIQAKGITKSYGTQVAVNNVSFSIQTGEVVGFIGPNGAGKSTTMKIITGTLPPDTGSVTINDLSALEYKREIRRLIGYLPEHNPLYLEMYVREYLQYVAGLYLITGKTARERIARIIEMSGLSPEVHKKIGTLSKGFRQRVGLAQALIHDPEILILDEPTSGLDPNQLVEIRNLIAGIGKEKTVLLSTHILQEVEAICDRVMIINRGEIVADELAETLKKRGERQTQTIHVELENYTDPQIWGKLLFINHVKSIGENQFLLETHEMRDIRADIFKFAVSQELTILSLSLKKKSLEEVFREITSH
ncbi:MAG: gliding motility-associated ABC transporter ATP-binding subunit GldA [Bacteroidales bacterium]|nr:gliding motility-associated ABC transporter ATP-binding subunit GldA [Bacteroidales bacterium]